MPTPAAASTTMTVRCRLFARYADLVGLDDVSLALPRPATVADAVAALRALSPAAARLPERPLVAVNQVHALLTEPVADGDEVALLPPLAGG